MDFWKETNKIEAAMQSDINYYNALLVRSRSDYSALLLESSKYAMCIGRTNRAWALLFMAKYYWDKSRKQYTKKDLKHLLGM